MGQRGMANQHVAAGVLRSGLQAEGLIHRITESGMVGSRGAAQIPDRRETGVDAGSNPDRLVEVKALPQ